MLEDVHGSTENSLLAQVYASTKQLVMTSDDQRAYGTDEDWQPEDALMAQNRHYHWIACQQQLLLQVLPEQGFQHLGLLRTALLEGTQGPCTLW